MDDMYTALLRELECPICTLYMSPPIVQCQTGHSICEACRKRMTQCPLCMKPFSDARNISLEQIAGRIQYPCINAPAGCTAKLTVTNRDYHERNCTHGNYRCMMVGCGWNGAKSQIVDHWRTKNLSTKIYKMTNMCHMKMTKPSMFVNLVETDDELFWYKCKVVNNMVYFAVQYIGAADNAESFYYEVEVFKAGHPKKRLLIGDYCQGVHLNEELYTVNGCPAISTSILGNYCGIDQMLIYNLRVHPNKSTNNSVPQRMHHASSNPSLKIAGASAAPHHGRPKQHYNQENQPNKPSGYQKKKTPHPNQH